DGLRPNFHCCPLGGRILAHRRTRPGASPYDSPGSLPMNRRPTSLSLMARLTAVATAAALLGGCSIQFSGDGEAHDQWKKSYTLTQPGTFEIRDSNGLIQIEAGGGNAVEVVADRTMRAGTDEAAKEALAHFEFVETVTPSRVAIDSSNFQSMMLG